MANNALSPTGREPLVRRIGLAAGPLLFVLVLVAPLPPLDSAGGVAVADFRVRATLGLALWMSAWWITEALPLAATSLLPLAALPAFGVMSGPAVAAYYFSDIVALFLGGFCLALAMQKAGLHQRIALIVLSAFGTRPRRLVLGFLCASALLSMWVSNTATTLMLIPVALTVVAHALPGERTAEGLRFAAACLLAVAFGASIGGVGTTIGSPPNAYMQGFFNQRYAAEIQAGALPEITFGRWMLVGVPLVVALVPACWLLLTRFSPGVPRALPGFETSDVAARLKSSTGVSMAEWFVMITFFVTALAWITHSPTVVWDVRVPFTGWDEWFRYGGRHSLVSDGTIAIAAALVLFATPVRPVSVAGAPRPDRLLTWEFASPRLPWGALLLFGGGLALAQAFEVGGLTAYLKAAFGTLAGVPVWLVVLIVILGVSLVSELASNTASAAMAVPVLASLAAALHVDAAPLLMAATLGASCGYALPVATPPNTIVYATGEVSVAQMAKAGVLLDLVAAVCMYVAVMVLVRAVM